jgi:hypothetical protein
MSALLLAMMEVVSGGCCAALGLCAVGALGARAAQAATPTRRLNQGPLRNASITVASSDNEIRYHLSLDLSSW